MKTRLFLLACITVTIALHSCDRVTQPYIIITDLDTNLYPGDFIDYLEPTFPENTNTLRNVMIEDYTGHKCSFCPGAAGVAEGLETANPGRVFVATIHAGASPDGLSDFQKTNASGSYTRDFTTPEGLEMAGTFYSAALGLDSNPKGCINRIGGGGPFFLNASVWDDSTTTALSYAPDVNIQAISNYFPETHGAYIHVETEFINDLTGDYNIVGYILENKIVDWQNVFGTDTPDYEHHNVHIGNLFGETWGRAVATSSATAGTKVQTNFSYALPATLEIDDLHFLFFVYNKNTYEVLQVIEHEL